MLTMYVNILWASTENLAKILNTHLQSNQGCPCSAYLHPLCLETACSLLIILRPTGSTPREFKNSITYMIIKRL